MGTFCAPSAYSRAFNGHIQRRRRPKKKRRNESLSVSKAMRVTAPRNGSTLSPSLRSADHGRSRPSAVSWQDREASAEIAEGTRHYALGQLRNNRARCFLKPTGNLASASPLAGSSLYLPLEETMVERCVYAAFRRLQPGRHIYLRDSSVVAPQGWPRFIRTRLQGHRLSFATRVDARTTGARDDYERTLR